MDTTKLKSRLSDKVKETQSVASVSPVVSNATKNMQKLTITSDNSGYVALTSNALDIIRENMKNQPLALDLFDIVKSPAGGATVFSVPGLSGDDAEKELTGIVLDYMTPRAYWDTPDPVEGTPPVCLSRDSIVSHDGKVCAHCPYNDFGSRDGESNAKACKESVLIFLLRPNNILPLLIRIPVTSKGRFLKYTVRLVGNMTPLTSVVTKITLQKATSKAGEPYALFNFEAVRILAAEEAVHAKNYARQFMQIVNAAETVSEPSNAK
mgnify:CR=1 FL=1